MLALLIKNKKIVNITRRHLERRYNSTVSASCSSVSVSGQRRKNKNNNTERNKLSPESLTSPLGAHLVSTTTWWTGGEQLVVADLLLRSQQDDLISPGRQTRGGKSAVCRNLPVPLKKTSSSFIFNHSRQFSGSSCTHTTTKRSIRVGMSTQLFMFNPGLSYCKCIVRDHLILNSFIV